MLEVVGVVSGRETALAGSVRRAVFVLPFLLVGALLAVKISRPWTYWHVAGIEDGPIEWLTAIIYLAAALLAGMLAYRFHRDRRPVHEALSVVLFVGMFLIGMEEISWGQRVFDIASPDFFMKANRQQEINFHNLGRSGVLLDAAYLLVTSYAMTARFWVPKLLQRWAGGRFASLARLVCPPGFLAPYFLAPFLLYLYYVNVPLLQEAFGDAWGYGYIPDQGYFMISRDQEPAECILALGFLFFVIWLLIRQAAGEWRVGALGRASSKPIKQHRYFEG